MTLLLWGMNMTSNRLNWSRVLMVQLLSNWNKQNYHKFGAAELRTPSQPTNSLNELTTWPGLTTGLKKFLLAFFLSPCEDQPTPGWRAKSLWKQLRVTKNSGLSSNPSKQNLQWKRMTSYSWMRNNENIRDYFGHLNKTMNIIYASYTSKPEEPTPDNNNRLSVEEMRKFNKDGDSFKLKLASLAFLTKNSQ
jgi:hypothetical protein